MNQIFYFYFPLFGEAMINLTHNPIITWGGLKLNWIKGDNRLILWNIFYHILIKHKTDTNIVP